MTLNSSRAMATACSLTDCSCMVRELASLWMGMQNTAVGSLLLQPATLVARGLGSDFRAGKAPSTLWPSVSRAMCCPQTCSFMHSDNIIGDPASLSDARLKSEVTSVSGEQALSVLSQIQGCTYEREDLEERRLGLIADEVELAIDQLAIDNVISSKWHNNEQYKTLDYSRLVSLLIPAVNKLAQEVKDLKSIVNNNGSGS